MTPPTNENWENFEKLYKKYGAYKLSVGLFKNNEIHLHVDFEKYSILKKEIIVKSAWEIGPNDIERMVLKHDDDPLIPADVEFIPFLEIKNN